MDYTDIHKCIQILQEKSKWFLQKENIAEKIQCFDTIQKAGTPNTIYSLIKFLRSDNVLLRAKAAETIVCLFGKLKSMNDYSETLKHLHIEKSDLDFYRFEFDGPTYVQLLGIASLNSSGYVREKALDELVENNIVIRPCNNIQNRPLVNMYIRPGINIQSRPAVNI